MQINACSDIGRILILSFQTCLHSGKVDQVEHLAPVKFVILFNGIGCITDRCFYKLHLFDPVLDQFMLLLQRIFLFFLISSIHGHFSDVVQ